MAIETDICLNGLYYLEVKLVAGAISHYENLGYYIPREFDKRGRLSVPNDSTILVKLTDLKENSGQRVTKVCDFCGKKMKNYPYQCILQRRTDIDDFKDTCKECSPIKNNKVKRKNISIENSILYKNPELAKEIHPTLNGKISADKIYASSGLKCWWLCTVCGNPYEMSPNVRLVCNCPYCSGRIVNDTNCIWATDPEFAKLLWDSEDGNKYTISSSEKVDFKCQKCKNKIKNKKINYVYNYLLSCPMCSDGISYPEKFMANVLRQLKIEVEYQKMFEWSKVEHENKILNGNKKYDFFISSLNCIIEVHGEQHYRENTFKNIGGRTLSEEEENDKLKEQLAKQNKIENYIVIDCSQSKLEYIKDNIVKSYLSELLELKEINWLECHEFASNSLIKLASELWNNGNKSSKKISIILGYHNSTIIKYLNIGVELGICDYDPKKTVRDSTSRPVVQLSLDNEYIREFPSMLRAEKELSIFNTSISAVCRGKFKQAGGFKWMYKDDYDKQYLH